MFHENFTMHVAKLTLNIIKVSDENLFKITKIKHKEIFDIFILVNNSQNEILKLLLDFDIFDNNQENNGTTPATLAFKVGNFEALYELLTHNALYPNDFSQNFLHNKISLENVYMQKILNFIAHMNELHELIDEDFIKEKFRNYRQIYPHLKYFHNVYNKSLLMKLSNDNLIKLHDCLINELDWCPHEKENDKKVKENFLFYDIKEKDNFNRILKTFSYKTNFIKILEASGHFIAAEEPSKNFFSIANKSKLTKFEYFKIIQEILRKLNKFSIISEFLKLLAAYNHKKVIYDFTTSRQYPCEDNKKYLNRNEVIFCCKDLLDFPLEIITGEMSIEEYEKPKISTNGFSQQIITKDPIDRKKLATCYSSIAHELCHWVLQFTYENFSKPFPMGHLTKRLKFMKIALKSNLEELFENQEICDKFEHAEIFPRLTQLIVENEGNFHSIKAKFLPLFEFLQNFILSDVEKVSNHIFSIKKIEEVNEHFGVIDKVQKANVTVKNEFLNFHFDEAKKNVVVLKTNYPIIAISALYQFYYSLRENRKHANNLMTKYLESFDEEKSENNEKFLIFIEKSQIFIQDYREPLIEAFESCENSIIIIYCKKNISSKKIFEIQTKLKTFSRIIFVCEDVKDLSSLYKVVNFNFDINFLTFDSIERLKDLMELNFDKNSSFEKIFNSGNLRESLESFVNDDKMENDRINTVLEKADEFIRFCKKKQNLISKKNISKINF